MTKALRAGPRDVENYFSIDSCLRLFNLVLRPIWH